MLYELCSPALGARHRSDLFPNRRSPTAIAYPILAAHNAVAHPGGLHQIARQSP